MTKQIATLTKIRNAKIQNGQKDRTGLLVLKRTACISVKKNKSFR